MPLNIMPVDPSMQGGLLVVTHESLPPLRCCWLLWSMGQSLTLGTVGLKAKGINTSEAL